MCLSIYVSTYLPTYLLRRESLGGERTLRDIPMKSPWLTEKPFSWSSGWKDRDLEFLLHTPTGGSSVTGVTFMSKLECQQYWETHSCTGCFFLIFDSHPPILLLLLLLFRVHRELIYNFVQKLIVMSGRNRLDCAYTTLASIRSLKTFKILQNLSLSLFIYLFLIKYFFSKWLQHSFLCPSLATGIFRTVCLASESSMV